MAKKNACPVCMTKMNLHSDGHTLICPECGYKLCDHSYTDRSLFSEDHYHSDYVTYNKPTPSSVSPRPTPQRGDFVQNGSGYQKNAQKAGKKKHSGWELFFIIMFIVYLIMLSQQ